jgi:hypothetical protein
VRSARSKTFKPRVEELEDRLLLTTWKWWTDAKGDHLWSTKGNWMSADAAGNPGDDLPPRPGEDVVFTSQPGGANLVSIMDLTNGTVEGKIINSLTIVDWDGTLTLQGPLTVNNLCMSSGTVTPDASNANTARLRINGTLPGDRWSGGTLKCGVDLLPGGKLTIDGNVALAPEAAGTSFTIWAAAPGGLPATVSWTAGDIATAGRASIVNQGEFKMAGQGTLQSGGVRFTNMGTVFKFGAGTTSTIQLEFDHLSGTVKVQGGLLNINGTGISGGEFAVSGELMFTSPNYRWGDGTIFTYGGTVTVAGNIEILASVDFGAIVWVENGVQNTIPQFTTLAFRTGQISGQGTLNIWSTLIWTGGVMATSGAQTVLQKNASASVQQTVLFFGSPTLEGRTFVNYGQVRLQGTNFFMRDGAVFKNMAVGATQGDFMILDDSGITAGAGATALFLNQGGMLEKLGGDGVSEIGVPVITWGDVRSVFGKLNFSGGSLDLRTPLLLLAGTVEAVGGDIEVAGTYEQDDGSTIAHGNTFTIDGDFVQEGGSLSADIPATVLVAGDYNKTGGSAMMVGSLVVMHQFLDDGGTFTLWDPGSISAGEGVEIGAGGELGGSGTIYASVVNSGRIDAGGLDTIGVLTINGDYTQSGTLALEMTANMDGYDQLVVHGTANFGGVLAFHSITDAVPGWPDIYLVVSYSICASLFDSYDLQDPNPGSWLAKYDDPAGYVSLHVVWNPQEPPPGP